MFVIAHVRYRVPESTLAEHNAEHRAYLAPYKASGKVVLAGPFYAPGASGRCGGFIVFDVESADEVARIMEDDPFQRRGFYDLELLEWRPTLGKERLAPTRGEAQA